MGYALWTWQMSSSDKRICGYGRCGYETCLLVGGEYMHMEYAFISIMIVLFSFLSYSCLVLFLVLVLVLLLFKGFQGVVQLAADVFVTEKHFFFEKTLV